MRSRRPTSNKLELEVKSRWLGLPVARAEKEALNRGAGIRWYRLHVLTRIIRTFVIVSCHDIISHASRMYLIITSHHRMLVWLHHDLDVHVQVAWTEEVGEVIDSPWKRERETEVARGGISERFQFESMRRRSEEHTSELQSH